MKLRLVETSYGNYKEVQNDIKNTVYSAFEGTDFFVGNISPEVKESITINFDVTAYGPDGEMNREATIYVPEFTDLDDVRNACEDWMSDHSTPDVFYEKEELKESWLESQNKVLNTLEEVLNNDPTFTDKDRASEFLEGIIGWIKDYAKDNDLFIDENNIMDSEESDATQTEDIAKKEEYKELVTPTFKVGKKISLDR